MAWYVTNTAYQGLVIDNDTGANVAVVYDKANAPMIAQAPAMADVLRRVRALITEGGDEQALPGDIAQDVAYILNQLDGLEG
jgi:hypothetical protein